MTGPRLGFFTRLLEDAPAADRYRFALEQIEQAERSGFASAWVAQHHFGEHEGGLPSPFVLLAAAAERTSRIALATGVVTLPIDDPLRVAEDAVVLDQLSGGRVQLGLATGGNTALAVNRYRTCNGPSKAAAKAAIDGSASRAVARLGCSAKADAQAAASIGATSGLNALKAKNCK